MTLSGVRAGVPLALLLGACRMINYGSNLPDAGLCPSLDGGGSGTLTGTLAFPVVSATESLLAYDPAVWDAGRVVGWEDAGPSFIRITLLGPSGPCPADAGACQSRVEADLDRQADAGSWDGVYPLGDGGLAVLGVERLVGSSSTGWLYALATSGQIQIIATQACAMSGSFSASFSLAVSDAGADGGVFWVDGGTLSGTFQAVYGDSP